MHKKFEINRTKIKGSCHLERKVVPHDSKSDLPLVFRNNMLDQIFYDIFNTVEVAEVWEKNENHHVVIFGQPTFLDLIRPEFMLTKNS